MTFEALIICNQCDLMLKEVALESGGKALCARCGNELYRSQPNGLRHSLSFALTSAALFLISNAFPIVTINSQGLTNSATLLDAAERLMRDGMPSIAALVFATTFLMPALEILALIYLLLPLNFGRLPSGLSIVFRLVYLVKPWAMIEVFMLGLLVTVTKLNAFASVKPDIGLASFVLLMFSVTVAAANFDSYNFWKRVEALRRSRGGVY